LCWIRDTRAIVTHIPNAILIRVGLIRIIEIIAVVWRISDAVVVDPSSKSKMITFSAKGELALPIL